MVMTIGQPESYDSGTHSRAKLKTDAIQVKVTLLTGDQDNDSSIQKDWRMLLAIWAETNDCEIAKIEWTRYRQRFVHNPGKDHDDIFWEKVENG